METSPDHFLPSVLPHSRFIFSLSFSVCVPFFFISFPFRRVSPFFSRFVSRLPARINCIALHCNSAEVGSGPVSRQIGAALLLASIPWSDRRLAFACALEHRQAGRVRCRYY